MNPSQPEDTIAALATPAGEGGIAVLRVSGARAFEIVSAIFQKNGKKICLRELAPQTLHFGEIYDDRHHLIDQVVLGIFHSPRSYTGEDIVEISAHGGLAIVKKILRLLIQTGARHAEPGEFTKRAFINGKLDLPQAEAVLDLIKAKSELSVTVAARQLAGSLSLKFKKMKEELLKVYAHMEAFLDFPEDELEIYSDDTIRLKLSAVAEDMDRLIRSFNRNSLLQEGITVAIIGRPNVGKSSLFNALLERDRAIVSPYPGTTRDLLEEPIELGGRLVRLVDTAGLASSLEHPLEQMGMERTRRVLEEAYLCLFLVDASQKLTEEDKKIYSEIPGGKKRLLVLNKCDLEQKISMKELEMLAHGKKMTQISSACGTGLDHLEYEILSVLEEIKLEAESEQITRLRHCRGLEISKQALVRAQELFLAKEPLELVTLEIKSALDSLREMIGEIYSEDLLDVIFSEFCIGK